MKKMILVLAASLLCVTACSASTTPQSTATLPPATSMPSIPGTPAVTQATTTAADYFAFKKDVRLTYKGTGNEFVPYVAYVDYLKEGVVQLRQVNAGTTSVFVYTLADGTVKKVFQRGETYFRHDFTAISNLDEILIKDPIQTGTEWTLKDGSVRRITAVDKQISTASGAYQALEITTKRPDSTQKDYYAKGIGLVKTEFSWGDEESAITSELEMTEVGVPCQTTVRFYFPEFEKDRVMYEDRDVQTYTNEDVRSKLQEGLKTIPVGSNLTNAISDATQILGISLNDEKGIVTVDFSSDLTTDMNEGSSLEALLIKSITNTIGHYFQTDKVAVTVEGKPYESGHIALKEGEYFTVSEADAVPYQAP